MTRKTFDLYWYPADEHVETLNPYILSPTEVQPGDQIGYKIIARLYPGGFWTAYRGGTNWDDDQVRAFGDAISEEIAKELFPCFSNNPDLTYRR